VGKLAFLGLDFDIKTRDQWIALLLDAGKVTPFQYLVTPNVDHIVNYHDGTVPAPAYDAATYKVCDSRIVSKLAALKGLTLDAFPGSDMVRDFFATPGSEKVRVAVFGPSAEDFAALKAVYPAHDLLWIEAPMLKPGTDLWKDTVARLRDAPFDLLFCCISHPKQEIMCLDLQQAGRANGLALCVGASLDFLTGKQQRAPGWIAAAHLEWLHRLLSNPRRMWRRYLVRGPRIFLLVLGKK